MKHLQISLAAILALVLTAACGNLASVLGTGNPSTYPTNQSTDIQGTVTNVDTRAQRIDVTVNSSNGYPGGQTTSIYFDSHTQFSYQNRSVSPSTLRRGDQIDIRANNNGNGQYTADTVYILGNGSTSPTNTYPGNTYPSNNQTADIQGTVSYVDTQAQRIDVTSGYTNGLLTNGAQGNFSIYYDSQTPVNYQGKSYSPTALERGDQIDARVYDNGNGRYIANSITVTHNVRQ